MNGSNTVEIIPPSLDDIMEARDRLGDKVQRTPVWQWKGDVAKAVFGNHTDVFLKLELFQYGGSFKPRGALMNMLDLSAKDLRNGVTAVSAGNHAIAVAFAAGVLNTTAKVVMPKSANKARVEKCRSLGAEVVLVDDVHQAFEKVEEIEKEEGRTFIHPFEGPLTALGTATVGLELGESVPGLEAVIIPIGGGGLCAGIASAIRQMQPECQIYGVEPEGADSMHRSFLAGRPESIEQVKTIADSLGAPHAAPYSFALCQRYVDGLVKISDEEMAQMMMIMFDDMKLAVEPAAASAAAALRGPLHERLTGKKVGIIVCGSNIDFAGFHEIINRFGLIT